MTRPEITIRLDHSGNQFFPGDVLVCEYEVKLTADQNAMAVESSVLWTTTGKGEEDFGVHFFERRPKSMLHARNLSQPHRISTVLPQTPLSYDGAIVQVRWSVRLRVFLGSEQYTQESHFQLGYTAPLDNEVSLDPSQSREFRDVEAESE